LGHARGCTGPYDAFVAEMKDAIAGARIARVP
jgi:hypothetical protein